MQKTRAIEFHPPSWGAPDHVMADVEIPITDGPLAGLTVTGIRIRADKEDVGHLYVTFSGRPYEKNGERRYWSFLRSDEPGAAAAARERIVRIFREFAGLPEPRR